jgi:hypothetical protein
MCIILFIYQKPHVNIIPCSGPNHKPPFSDKEQTFTFQLSLIGMVNYPMTMVLEMKFIKTKSMFFKEDGTIPIIITNL